jgi:hypothetical protein
MCTRKLLIVYTRTVTLDSQVTDRVCMKGTYDLCANMLNVICRQPNNMIIRSFLSLYFQVCQEMEVERVKVTVITNQNEIDTWIDKDINAQGIIFYNIEPSFQVALEGSGSSNEMWNRLILRQSSSINLVSELTIFFPRSLCYGTHKQTKNDGRRIKQHRMPRI